MTAEKPLAIDLYSGLGGWTEGLIAEGYRVIGFDNERHVYGTERYPGQLVIQDVRTIHGRQFKDAALIVGSSPCQEFSYGQLVPSGGPSCVQCSKLALVAGIAGVWLYHDAGWRRYEAKEFHALSLAAALPRAPAPHKEQSETRCEHQWVVEAGYGPRGHGASWCQKCNIPNPDAQPK